MNNIINRITAKGHLVVGADHAGIYATLDGERHDPTLTEIPGGPSETPIGMVSHTIGTTCRISITSEEHAALLTARG